MYAKFLQTTFFSGGKINSSLNVSFCVHLIHTNRHKYVSNKLPVLSRLEGDKLAS